MIEVELPDGTIAEFPEGTSPDVMKKALARFKTGSAQGQSPAMSEGLSKLSSMTQNPPMPERSMGQALYDNVIGDPTDGVDSVGERFGRGANDVAKAGAAGVARGTAALMDLPGQLVSGGVNLAASGLEKTGIISPVVAESMRAGGTGMIPGGGTAGKDAITAATMGGSEYRGKTTAGKYAGTVGEFLPSAATLGGMSLGNLVRFGAVPGVFSEAAGQATEGTAYEGAARVAAAVAGSMLPNMLAKGATKLASPYGGADPERLKLAAVLDDFGVPISAGQRVGNEALRRKEGLTGAGQNLSDVQREAFTKAALKTAGTDATRATPEVLAEMSSRIGAVFDDVTRGLDVVPDANGLTALSGAVNTYKSLAPTGSQAPLISNILKETTKFYRGGNPVPAATVNTWRSGLSKLTASADAATREAAQMALEAVDDMLTGAMTAAGKPENVARLATARGEWRNFLAIQKAASGAGEGAAAGLLSPSALRNAVVQQGSAAFAQGRRGDLGRLARAGEGVMKQLPDSGTPAGMFARVPSGTVPGGLGALIGGSLGGTSGAVAGAVLGSMAPGVAGAIRMSGPVQNYLANQLMNPISARMGTGAAAGLLPFAGDSRNALARP